MTNIITEYPQFFTATILDWEKLLAPDKYKDIIIDSLRFLVHANRIKLNAFVVMDNHIPPTGADLQLLAQICSSAKWRGVSVHTNTVTK